MNNNDALPPIKCEMTDPRGKQIILFEDTWDIHIQEGHPEMEGHLNDVVTTIENPDWIREGRNTETEELYVKVKTRSKLEFTGTLAATRIIDGKMVIMTTAYEGNDSEHKGKMKWSKSKGELL